MSIPLSKPSWGHYLSVVINLGSGIVGRWCLEASEVGLNHRMNVAKVSSLVPVQGPTLSRVRTRPQSELLRTSRRSAEADIAAAVEAKTKEQVKGLVAMYQNELDAVQSELSRLRGQQAAASMESERIVALQNSKHVGEYVSSPNAMGGASVLEFPCRLGHVSNVVGSSEQKSPSGSKSWKDYWKLTIGEPFPRKCQYEGCNEEATLGAHGT